MKSFKYRCPHCDKRYKQEKAFHAHTCKEQERAEHLRTADGQKALMYFQYWNKVQGRRIPTIEAFAVSSVYNAFVNLVNFTKKVGLPDTELYVKLMTKKGLQPSSWTNETAYAYYINYMDKRSKSKDQAMITVDTIFNICDELDVPSSDFFEVLLPTQFIQLTIRRQLSPWILLNSKKFLAYYGSALNAEQRKIYESIHSPKEWKARFIQNKSDVENMKKVVFELGL